MEACSNASATPRSCPQRGLSPRFRRHFSSHHQRGDLIYRVQVLDPRLVRLDPDAKMVFQKSHQLERADRIEDPSRDQPGFDS